VRVATPFVHSKIEASHVTTWFSPIGTPTHTQANTRTQLDVKERLLFVETDVAERAAITGASVGSPIYTSRVTGKAVSVLHIPRVTHATRRTNVTHVTHSIRRTNMPAARITTWTAMYLIDKRTCAQSPPPLPGPHHDATFVIPLPLPGPYLNATQRS
jgi:hypothetical protein